jgi:hypothetical protein
MLRNVMCAAIVMTMLAGEASVYAGNHRGRNAQCCGGNTSYQHTRNHYRGGHNHRQYQVVYQNSGWDSSCCPSYSRQNFNCGCDVQYPTSCCDSQMWSYQNVSYSQPAVECCTAQVTPAQSVRATVVVPQPEVPAPATAPRPAETFKPATAAATVPASALITNAAPQPNSAK